MTEPPRSLPASRCPGTSVRRFTPALLLVLAAGCGGDGPPAEVVPQGAGGAAGAVAPALPGSTGAPPEGSEAVSFLGGPLSAPPLPADLLEQRTRQLGEAEAALSAAPGNADALIWVGRRQAYLGRYRDAIETFSEGIRAHPEDPRMYRHRGHRWITVRELDSAIADFRRGVELIAGTEDEVEPDGLPNARGIPTSTLHFNIWYHLGLAHYLRGELDDALVAYEACMRVSTNPDARAATSYWLYLTLRRLGRDEAAAAVLEPFGPDYEVIENQAYLDLLRLFRGERTPGEILGPAGEEPTLEGTTGAYGVGAWHLVNGRQDEALDIFRRVVAARDQWAAFGYVAAEAELVRAGATP